MTKQINRLSIKLRFPSMATSAFFYSVFIHVAVLYALLNITPTIAPPLQKKVIKIISAKLFYKKESSTTVVEQKVKVSERSNEQSNIKKTDTTTTTTTSQSKAKSVIDPLDKIKTTKNKNSEVKTHKNTTTRRVSAQNSLQSLREQLNNQIRDQSAKEYYKAFVESKNFIPRSTTKFKQLPEAKAVDVKINCDSAFNKGVKIISGLLGGSIKCNIPKLLGNAGFSKSINGYIQGIKFYKWFFPFEI
ncbi:MAG: hypothetical protein HRT37_13660 [Alteromonadaceae bacterium]|nr:hypothetical protein [Alteromonadaceae bacterium]